MPSPAPNTYPFDGSGTVSTNLVQNEIHTLTVINYRDYHYLIPDFAPFYAESLVLEFRAGPADPFVALTEGIDYYPALQFIGASRATGKPVYGAISFNNLSLTGQVRIGYQTVGGEWTLDVPKLTELTANIIYNPRTTTWENVINPPNHFPPVAHSWELDDMVGQQEVLSALHDIEQAILGRSSEASLLNHITNYNNPHRVTKVQVGLGRVQNYAPATIAECIAAQSSQLYVTPIGLKAFFDSLGLDRALQFVSLQEVVDKVPVAKILTFDLFLEYMKLYGGDGGGSGTQPGATTPLITYPTDQATYVAGQFFKNTTFIDTTPGTVNRVITLTGTGTHQIPLGTGSVKITGRGALGGFSTPQFVTKTEVLSGNGAGTFTVPAGGNILIIRGQGAAGTSGRTRKYSLDTASLFFDILSTNDAQLQIVGVPAINSVTPVSNLLFGNVFTVSVNVTINFIYAGSVPKSLTRVFNYNFVENDDGSTHGAPASATGNGNFWNIAANGELTNDHENLTFSHISTDLIPFSGSPSDLNLTIRTGFELNRQTGNEVLAGASVTTTINNAVRKYAGSDSVSSPVDRTDTIPTEQTTSTIISYNSPANTVLEITYQDYNAAGTWEITKYYSTKITNPTTGTSALIQDNDGSIVALPSTSTGDWMSTRTSIVLQPTASITTAYALQLVAASSNSTRRVFEYKYMLSGTEVIIRVVSELTTGSGGTSRGADAVITLLGRTETYFGSPDNNTVPQIRTDEIILNNAANTTVTYNCPTGTSVVLNYNEPNATQPITHADTRWEISTSSNFDAINIVEGTLIGKGNSFTLTQWKPTSSNVLVNNTTYYVRAKWFRSDGSESAWSDTRQFTYSSGVVNPPRDTELSRFCKGVDQWGTFADGTGGSYEKEISKNSVACGFVTPPPPVTPGVVLVEATAISSLSTIPQGSTSTVTVTLRNTVPGRSYNVEYLYKKSTDPDSSYTVSSVPALTRTVTGDASGATTILTFPLAHDGLTSGAYNGKFKFTDALTPANTVTSNAITVTFVGGVTTISNLVFSMDKSILYQGDVLTKTIKFDTTSLNKTFSITYYQKPSNTSDWASFNNPANTASVTATSASVNVKMTDQYNVLVPVTLTYDYKVVITDTSNSLNTATSNIVTLTRTGVTGSGGDLTISSSDTDLYAGENERITVNVTNGPTNGITVTADIYQLPQSMIVPLNTDGSVNITSIGGYKIGNVSIPVNTSGTGSAFVDNYVNSVGNSSTATSHAAGTFRTFAYSTGTYLNKKKSNEIFRTFNMTAVSNSKVTVSASPTSVNVGQSASIQVNLTGFPTGVSNSASYTVKLYYTPVGGTRTSFPVNQTVTVNSSGNGTTNFSYSNDGRTPPGNYVLEASVFDNTGAQVATPGGNTPGNIMVNRNTTISFTSTLGAAPVVTTAMDEKLTITLSGGPVNQTVSCAARARYISGNSAGVNTSQDYDTPFSITTDSNGNGTTIINAGNPGGLIPIPSVWSRKMVILSTGQVSSDMTARFVDLYDSISCTISSNVGGVAIASIPPSTPESIIIGILNAQPNTSIQMYARARYVSGNSSGVDVNRDYDTACTIQTNSYGNGTVTIPAGNSGGVIPYPSRWKRTAVHVASGKVSDAIYVDYTPDAGAVPQEALYKDVPLQSVNTNATIRSAGVARQANGDFHFNVGGNPTPYNVAFLSRPLNPGEDFYTNQHLVVKFVTGYVWQNANNYAAGSTNSIDKLTVQEYNQIQAAVVLNASNTFP